MRSAHWPHVLAAQLLSALAALEDPLLLIDNEVLYARGTRDAGANGACAEQTVNGTYRHVRLQPNG
jgi:hypothetical protein